jgi:cell division FtsZ-interacting protein ZapD
LAIANFRLFGRLKQQLSGRTMKNEHNVLETVAEILGEFPKAEVKSAFLHRKERYQWVADNNETFYPN